MCVSMARVLVMTGLLCVFSFWICELGVFVCARSLQNNSELRLLLIYFDLLADGLGGGV